MKKANFKIGDRFEVNNVKAKVAYINNGKAWLVPENDVILSNGRALRSGCAFVILLPSGKAKDGSKVKRVKK